MRDQGCDCRTRTKSVPPPVWVPDGVKVRLPVLANGEPLMDVNAPVLVSNQRALTFGPESFVRSIVTAWPGVKTSTALPSLMRVATARSMPLPGDDVSTVPLLSGTRF